MVCDCCRHEVCITWVPGHRDIPGNCRANDLARRGTTIELSDEFFTLGIILSTCKLIIGNAIVDLVKSRWIASNKGKSARKICQRLDRMRTATLLILQRNRLITVIRVITGHCIIGTHTRRIDLGHIANDFHGNCGDEEEDKTILHPPELGRKIKRHLGAYYMGALISFFFSATILVYK